MMSDTVIALMVATLGGAAVGVERQWSGHASGPDARFAGVRTFTLLGTLAGLSGLLWTWDARALAATIIAAAAAMIVAAYVMASSRDIDGTTEVAALVVLVAGTTAGLGHLAIASGVTALTWLVLSEKSRLHHFVTRLDKTGLSAAARFAVMAAVILPLLPEGPYGPLGGVRPRELWLLVLFFSGLSFAGYVARLLVGATRGYALAGLMGGLVSSTNVTLTFARLSRTHTELSMALAQGALAANAVLFLRVLAATSVLSPALAVALVPYMAAPFAVGVVAVAGGLWHARAGHVTLEPQTNPLQLRSSLEMALLFQGVLFAMTFVQGGFGEGGVVTTAALLGLTDVDALTMSMAKGVGLTTLTVPVAARAVAVGILANTALKMGVAATVGQGRFRLVTVAVLGLMAAALVVAITRLA
jgi:uncharacterized membrane protein (DUF4010 family)